MKKEVIKEMSKAIHQTAKDKGWWDKPRNTHEVYMLIITELAEAVEADRADYYAPTPDAFDKLVRMHCERYDVSIERAFRPVFQEHLKGTVQVELADAVIRCLDWIEHTGLFYEDYGGISNYKFTDNFAANTFLFTMLVGDSRIQQAALQIIGYAQSKGWDFKWYMEQKMLYNEGRERMHGGKKY